MICGAIFDIDGVLLDTLKIWKTVGSRYLTSIGISEIDDIDNILFSMSMEEGAEYIKKTYSLPIGTSEILSDIKNMLKKFYETAAEEKCGAKKTLDFLKRKNIPVVAATSGPKEYQKTALTRTGLHEYIQKIYTTSELGESKHTPLIYNTAAEYLNTPPHETLVFEDSLYALTTAKSAGFVTIGIADEYGDIDQDGIRKTADVYLENLNLFPDIWDRVNCINF